MRNISIDSNVFVAGGNAGRHQVADEELLSRAQAGDEQAFVALVRRYQNSMVRLARSFVPSAAVAEDVAQEAWLGMMRGVDKFEGRSSFKAWLMRIVVNRARTTGASERRSIAIGYPADAASEAQYGCSDGSRQLASPSEPWVEDIDDRIRALQMTNLMRSAVNNLPAGQRAVVTLRDMEGLSSKEACAALDISEGNQRVLLHRARSCLRQSLEAAFDENLVVSP